MSWYSLRLEGTLYSATELRRVHLLSGQPSLQDLLDRLIGKVAGEVDDTVSQLPSGMKAALQAQLSLTQWVSWDACMAAERKGGHPHPLTMPPRKSGPGSGSS